MSEYYKEALKLAQKEARACTADGISPTLPALEEILTPAEMISHTELGIQIIPAEFIIGTRTAARGMSFARNFMPLLEPDTEFAVKWQRLSLSHVSEGIRDAVKVWEYRNRYYVEEGNKRVSVLKFFGAATVSAEVSRILPVKDGSEDTELYYELIDFQKISRINSVEFSRKGSCAELQRLTGKATGERWSDAERDAFSGMLYFFRDAYEAQGGKKLSITLGDALLACIRIYGYQEMRYKGTGEMRSMIARVWEELVLLQQSEPVEIRLEPAVEKKPSVLTRVLDAATGVKPLHVAFIHDKTPETSAWTNGHEMGKAYAERVLGDRIVAKSYFDALEDDPEEVIRKAASDGNTVLFTTSPRLLTASLRCAAKDPGLTILNCSLNMPHRYVRSYHARMYEAKFIIGAIAGALAGNNSVGYIADYPIYGQIAGINAFAFGVEMVNPRARVHLEWSSTDSAEAAQSRLEEQGILLISSQDQGRLRYEGRSSFGLSVVGGETRAELAIPVWEWGIYYEKMLRRIMDHSSQEEYTGSVRALNYYWGMRDGVVSLHYSDKLPESVQRLARILENSVRSGACDPFHGPINDQNGREMVGPHASLGADQIIGMDWLAENVVGRIPSYEELTEAGKATVDALGVIARPEDSPGGRNL